jgi:hypothetical protein
MAEGSAVLRLTDIIEAIERVRDVLGNMSLEDFEFDWQKQWWLSAAWRSSPKRAVGCPTR